MAVERSKAVDSAYSFISSPSLPTTNILAPSFENAMPVGESSCDKTSKGGSTNVAVEISNVPSIVLPDVSRTAPGWIVSSGVVSPAIVARCDAVRLNEIVAPSAAVSSSPALNVIPPPV